MLLTYVLQMEEDSSSSSGGGSDLDEHVGDDFLSIFKDMHLAPIFKLPPGQPSMFGDDVCEEMDRLLFSGDNRVYFSNVREGGDSILQYRRWVKFAVEMEDCAGRRRKGSRSPCSWRNGAWVCCVLARNDQPFGVGSDKYTG